MAGIGRKMERFLGWTEQEKPQIFEALAAFFHQEVMKGHPITNEQMDALFALANTAIAPTERLHLDPRCPKCGFSKKPDTNPAM